MPTILSERQYVKDGVTFHEVEYSGFEKILALNVIADFLLTVDDKDPKPSKSQLRRLFRGNTVRFHPTVCNLHAAQLITEGENQEIEDGYWWITKDKPLLVRQEGDHFIIEKVCRFFWWKPW